MKNRWRRMVFFLKQGLSYPVVAFGILFIWVQNKQWKAHE